MKKTFFYTLLLAFMAFGTSDDTTVTAKPKRKVAEKKAKRQQRKAQRQQRKAQRMAEKRARHDMRKGRKDRQKRISLKDLIDEKVLDNEKPNQKSDKNITPQIVIPSITPIEKTPQKDSNIKNEDVKPTKSETEDGGKSKASSIDSATFGKEELNPEEKQGEPEEKKGWSTTAKVAGGLATTAALAGVAHYTGLDGGYIKSAGQWIADNASKINPWAKS